MDKRAAGILMPITSLPSEYGIGCFSKSAYDFVDWLKEAGQSYWQILPLGPTSYGDSPYQSFSTFAGNPYFISLKALVEEGVLTKEDCDKVSWGKRADSVDYEKIYKGRYPLLRKAYENSDISKNPDYQKFVAENSWWLSDYALFMAVKDRFEGVEWTKWAEDIRLRWNNAMDYYREELYFDIEFQQYMQFKFYEQWMKLKSYANSKGIQIIGDIPIYVAMDSADAWAHPELFQLDEDGRLAAVAGVPPDAFTADGQLWGNPLYDWAYHKRTNYAWWVRRVRHALSIYDILRIDHFRGFDTYWAIPAGDKNARGGKWEQGPGMDLFRALRTALGDLPIVAEDLGEIFDSVRVLLAESGFPGMKVLQFSLNGTDSLDLPHNYPAHCVAYPGTHDNNTLRGWLENETTPAQRKQAKAYFALTEQEGEITGLLRGVLASPAELAIVTMADWLEKGSEARMNTPGNPAGNWQWRVAAKDLTPALARKIHEMSARYFRAEPLPEAEPKKEKAPAPQPKAKAADAKEEKTTAPAKKAAKSAK